MAAEQKAFPENWQIAKDYDPNQHKMQLKGKDYLDVQNRLIWFIRDQRNLIAAGLATTSYVVRTEMVEHDATNKWANFKTYVRDVLGNESTMYGSESSKDFGDYLEKASTKSLGRALVMLGYGTQFAPEIGEEGEADRPVDSPVKPRQQAPQPTHARDGAPIPADDTRKVVTPQISRDRARLQAEPITDKTPITYTESEPSPTAETVSDLVKISLAKQIGELRTKLRLDTSQYGNIVKRSNSNEEVLANLQQMWEDKQDGFPLDRPAQKAAQG